MLKFLLHPKTDLPFAHEDAQRFFPAIIALVVGLCVLLMSISLLLGQSLGDRKASASQVVSVHVPFEKKSDSLLAQVQTELKKVQGVKALERVDDATLKTQLKPWMEGLKNDDEWPLPAVFRLSFSSGTLPPVALVRERMRTLDDDIQVDAGAAWAEAFERIVTVVQGGLVVLSFLLLVALSAITVFITRTSMRLNQSAVTLLHGIGATDAYIARQFEQNAFALVLRGAGAGTVSALVLLVLVALVAGPSSTLLMPDVSIGMSHVLLWVFLPFLACVLARISARFAVLNQLKRMA